VREASTAVAAIRSFHHSQFPAARLAGERANTTSACVPARQTADTVGAVVRTLVSLRERGVLDQVVVVDAASADGTAQVAAGAGAEVHQEAELLPQAGPVLGKGDAMWRGLSVLSGEIVCFVDADTEGFDERFACGLLGPLLCEPGVGLVKGHFRRPFRAGQVTLAEGGGRVNELTARPLLARFYPQLAAVRQPLAGELAARRELLERLPFATGYGVEIAMLIDAEREAGVDAIAQVDLDERLNRHQPLSALAPMADAVLAAVTERLEREGRLVPAANRAALIERPPLRSVRMGAERAP
jgi:glucosyl-3-phosphoglycerate synthase